MSSLHSPSSLPITPILFSSSPRLVFRESLSFEFSSWEKHPPAARYGRGNPTRLKALVFLRRISIVSTQEPKFLNFRRNCKLESQTEAELLDSVLEKGKFFSRAEQNGIVDFVSKNGELAEEEQNNGCGLIKDAFVTIKNEASNLVLENAVSLTDMEAKKVTDESVKYADEKGKICSKIVGGLNVGDLIKKIVTLPIEERVKVLDLFKTDEKSMTISDYNDILTALAKAGEYDSAISFFSELSCRGLTPDYWSFVIMIQCLCKKNKPDEAKQVLEDMIRRGLHPNVVTFTCLINCLRKRGRVKKAFEVFEIMNQIGCKPTIRTYNGLIGGLCYVGRLEEAFELLKKIKNSSISPDIYTYTFVIDGFCKVGRSNEAMELLKEAEDMGIVPNIVTYNSLLNGFCTEGRPLEGLQLLNEMQQGDCPPEFSSYSIVLQGLLKWGEISAAWRIYKKMRVVGFQADERSMNTLLRGICKRPVIDETVLKDAMQLFEAIKENSHNPSPYTYCLMVQALAKGGELDKALFHLHEMVRIGYCPVMWTYNVIFRILCGEGRGNDALGVLVLMIETDKIPGKYSFDILLKELCRQGRILDAFGVYAAAIKRGVVLCWNPKNVSNVQKVFHQ